MGHEAIVRTGHGTTDSFKIGKEYDKSVYCYPAYLTSVQSTEKEMATYFSIFAWEISRTEEPGALQSMRSQTAGHNLVTKQQQ